MKIPSEPPPPLSKKDFLEYMRRHMQFLEGFAAAVENVHLKNRIDGIRSTLKQFAANTFSEIEDADDK